MDKLKPKQLKDDDVCANAECGHSRKHHGWVTAGMAGKVITPNTECTWDDRIAGKEMNECECKAFKANSN